MLWQCVLVDDTIDGRSYWVQKRVMAQRALRVAQRLVGPDLFKNLSKILAQSDLAHHEDHKGNSYC